MSAITKPSKTAPTNLLDYQDLAARLNDSVRHLRRLVHEDRIPYVKVGHFVRFDPDEIRQWLNANRHGG
ncbi:MAG: helix-turn-helix domain-containing protein [Acidimicrobiales bacterium]